MIALRLNLRVSKRFFQSLWKKRSFTTSTLPTTKKKEEEKKSQSVIINLVFFFKKQSYMIPTSKIVLAWHKESGFRILAWHKQGGISMSTATSAKSALVFRLLSALDMIIQLIFISQLLTCFLGNGFRHTLFSDIHIYILCQMKISSRV